MSEGRRRRDDRRRALHWAEWRWVFGGRRRYVRRVDDTSISRLDWYPAPLLGAAVMILGLSALDAGFTLQLLEGGLVTEANPLMDGLIQLDVRRFVTLKSALTGTCIIVLVLHSPRRLVGKVTLGHSLYVIAGLYMVLIGYELALIAQS